jgi:hypothetical protein
MIIEAEPGRKGSRISIETEGIRVWRKIQPSLTPAEVALVDPMAPLTASTAPEAMGNRLSPEELGSLAELLAATLNPVDSTRIKTGISLGFYGI